MKRRVLFSAEDDALVPFKVLIDTELPPEVISAESVSADAIQTDIPLPLLTERDIVQQENQIADPGSPLPPGISVMEGINPSTTDFPQQDNLVARVLVHTRLATLHAGVLQAQRRQLLSLLPMSPYYAPPI